jgi:hypothetical protein
MSTEGSISYPDATRLAELLQKTRLLRSDLSGIIERNRNSKAITRLIMASGLLDAVLEELSYCAPEQSE